MIQQNLRRFALLITLLTILPIAAACGKASTARPISTPPQTPIPPSLYVKIMGKGLAVDWAKTPKGIEFYSPKEVEAVKQKGFSHVRIRVTKDLTPTMIKHLDRVINDTLQAGLIPVLAYKGTKFEEDPSEQNFEHAVEWWAKAAEHFKNASPLLSFDILIEVSGQLSKQPQTLNRFYERVVAEIRKTNPHRIIFISPVDLSAPERLKDLQIPGQANGFLMAEWHFYAAGPSKTNPRKLWTTGTEAEKAIIKRKISVALQWQKQTGIYTWVGAWMPGDYNHGNHYSVPEQVRFATFVTCQLDAAHIPFAINSDNKFYDRVQQRWIPEMEPVLEAVLHPKCK